MKYEYVYVKKHKYNYFSPFVTKFFFYTYTK